MAEETRVVELSTNFDGNRLYMRKKFEFVTNRLNVLVGPNGTGKTVMLKKLREKFKKENTEFIYYSNLEQGGSKAKDAYLFAGAIDQAAISMTSSEGQNIIHDFGIMVVARIKKIIEKNPGKDLWILVDCIDSGLDIAGLAGIRNFVRLCLEDATKSNTTIIPVFSANSYGLVEGENCLYPYTGKRMIFKSYDEYKDFIMTQYKKIDARDDRNREKEQWRSERDDDPSSKKYKRHGSNS